MHAANFRSPYRRNSREHCARVEVAARAPLERAGGMQHGGDAIATVVATFTAFYIKRQDSRIGWSHVVNSCGAGVSGQVPRHRLTAPLLISDAVVSS